MTEKYAALVDRISGAMTDAATRDSDKLAPMMLACDVAAKVIHDYPREQRVAVLDIFLTRLAGRLDSLTAGETQ